MACTFGLSADTARERRVCTGSYTNGSQQYPDQPQHPTSCTHRAIMETCANCNIINPDSAPIDAFGKIGTGTV